MLWTEVKQQQKKKKEKTKKKEYFLDKISKLTVLSFKINCIKTFKWSKNVTIINVNINWFQSKNQLGSCLVLHCQHYVMMQKYL